MSETERRVRVERDGAVEIVTLDRPEKRNALDAAAIAQLGDALRAADRDDAVRVVLLRAAGPDFCAGADLSVLEGMAEERDALENLADAEQLGRLLVRMRRMRRPIVAAVHGRAWAGGAGLATACDLVVVSRDASIGYPEIRLGFVPAMVMALLRRSVGEKVAFDLVTGGGAIDAEEAQRLGLVNRVLDAERFQEAALEYAHTLAGRSASALELCKRLLYGIDALSFEEAIARGAEVNVLARMTPDTIEGVRAFLERKRGD